MSAMTRNVTVQLNMATLQPVTSARATPWMKVLACLQIADGLKLDHEDEPVTPGV
jgi:hypothetical protein